MQNHTRIIEWLREVRVPEPAIAHDTTDLQLKRKRQHQHQMPSPASGTSAGGKSIDDIVETPHRKRPRQVGDDDYNHTDKINDDDEAVIEEGEPTPRGPASRVGSGWARGTSDSGSTFSSTNSSSSRKSRSPTKRMRALDVCVLQMNPAHPRFPVELRALFMRLDTLATRGGVIPNSLRDDLMARRSIDSLFWNIDEHVFAPQKKDDVYKAVALEEVVDIYMSAQECFNMGHAEPSWNMLAHWPVFKLALASGGTAERSKIVSAAPCTTARLTGDPRGSKMVDFCIYIEPPEGDLAAQRLHALSRRSIGFSVNHTDYSPLCRRPIAVSAESKKPGEHLAEAHLQVTVWQDAQWSLLTSQASSADMIPFLPSLVIQGHDWQFVATSRDTHGTVGCHSPLSLHCSHIYANSDST